MKASIAIIACGATGLAAIASTARYYAGVDRPALVLSLVMAVGLCVGVLELWRVARRSARLRAELCRLPDTAKTAADLERLSPHLRALVWARLERNPAPLPAPVFAPFLIGLLVMLGLLGTFLGLFETVRGASLALSASEADVEALRTSLQLPMRGLMRSFGTSAAGLSASAMLGLAAVFARGARADLAHTLQALSTGRFSHLSLAQRQLSAIEALAEQGAALPLSARALEQTSASLETLREAFRDSHAQIGADVRAATERVGQSLDAGIVEVVKDVRAAFERGTADTVETAVSALRPLVERTVETTVATTTDHLTRVQAALDEQSQRTEACATRTITALEQHGKRLADTLSAVAERMREELTQGAASVGEHLTRGVAAEQAQHERAEALLSQLQAARQSFEDAAEQHVARLNTFVEASDERLRRAEDGSQERLQTLLTAVQANAQAQADQLSEQAKRLADTEAGLLSQQEQSVARLTELLTNHVQTLDERLHKSSELLEQAAGLVHAGGSELVTVAETFAAAVEQQRVAAQQWLESLGEIERSVADAGEAAAADVLGQHLARTHEVFDRQLRFQQELMDQLHRGSDAPAQPAVDEAHADA